MDYEQASEYYFSHLDYISQQEGTKPRIVCAACTSKNGKYIITSARHWDPLMRLQAAAMVDVNWLGGEQGFVDQYNIFYNRTDAWKVASGNFQVIRRVGGDESNDGTLYSENLY